MTFQEQMDFTNQQNRFMNHCGIRITALEEGCCRGELSVAEYCKNTRDTVHGGLLYTMADCVVSAYSRAVAGSAVTLDGTFHYLGNITGGTISAEATPIQLGHTVMVFRVNVMGEGRLLAEGIFTCYRIGGHGGHQ